MTTKTRLRLTKRGETLIYGVGGGLMFAALIMVTGWMEANL